MAAQSGIVPSESLSSLWSTALSSPSLRLLKITIEQEQLVSPLQLDSESGTGSFQQDWQLFTQDQVVAPDQPAYYLFREGDLPSSHNQWIFITYVPDTAAVRSKMLYASSRAALARSFGGEGRFSESIFATSPNELSHASYLSHLRSSQASAPLTARELELQQIKESERAELAQSQAEPRSMLVAASGGASVGLEWSEEAREAVEGLKNENENEEQGRVVQLEIEKERVILSSPQPTGLDLPPETPSFTFYRHSLGLVFIYSCPPSSPIKSRLLYSSSSAGIVLQAKALGLSVAKKIETSDPSEMTDEYILLELGGGGGGSNSAAPDSGTTTPLPSTPAARAGAGEKPGFARPTRPGRGRRMGGAGAGA